MSFYPKEGKPFFFPLLLSNAHKINVLLLQLLAGSPSEWEENESNSVPTYFQALHLLHCGWSGKFATF